MARQRQTAFRMVGGEEVFFVREEELNDFRLPGNALIVLRVFVIEKLAECETALEGDLLGWVVHDGKKIVFK